ncbi:tetratricopeptide repeat protein [Streptomyces niveus]|uniref:tetratricopeptide repeat protein n=1 Tax=Streptomyces niveus TaxID=193462 RepID=UPI0036A2B11E
MEAADLVSDERARLAGVASPVAAFYPSLHLNLGDVYRRLGEWDLARAHLERGLEAVGTLGDDGYGQLIKGGLDRLAQRLAERSDEPPSEPPSDPLSSVPLSVPLSEPASEPTEVNGPASG